VILFAVLFTRQELFFKKENLSGTATITYKSVEASYVSTDYFVQYEYAFQSEDGPLTLSDNSIQVSERLYNELQVGDKVPILYTPVEPYLSCPAEECSLLRSYSWLFILASVLWVFFFTVVLYRYRDQGRKPVVLKPGPGKSDVLWEKARKIYGRHFPDWGNDEGKILEYLLSVTSGLDHLDLLRWAFSEFKGDLDLRVRCGFECMKKEPSVASKILVMLRSSPYPEDRMTALAISAHFRNWIRIEHVLVEESYDWDAMEENDSEW